MNTLYKTISALGLIAAASTVSAVPIVGDISFSSSDSGSVTVLDGDGNILNGPDFTGAAFIDFSEPPPVNAEVNLASGDYASTVGSKALFWDFSIDPLAAGSLLWSFNANGIQYSFEMNDISFSSFTGGIVSLSGNGVAYATDVITGANIFDPTSGFWAFSTQGLGSELSFSAFSVPEPGIAMLLAGGLIGLGIATRARKSA